MCTKMYFKKRNTLNITTESLKLPVTQGKVIMRHNFKQTVGIQLIQCLTNISALASS